MSSDQSMTRSVTLLGILEVVKSMAGADAKERICVAHFCKDAILNRSGQSRQRTLSAERIIGEVIFQGHDLAALVTASDAIQIYKGHKLETHQRFRDISTMVAIKESNGVLVVIGKCQVIGKRIGLIYKLASDRDADMVISHYSDILSKQSTGGPSGPRSPVSALPDPPSFPPPSAPTLTRNPSNPSFPPPSAPTLTRTPSNPQSFGQQPTAQAMALSAELNQKLNIAPNQQNPQLNRRPSSKDLPSPIHPGLPDLPKPSVRSERQPPSPTHLPPPLHPNARNLPPPIPEAFLHMDCNESGSSWSDDDDFDDDVYEEVCFNSMGFDVEDSERVYMKRPLKKPTTEEDDDTDDESSDSQAEHITNFLMDDMAYIHKLENINKIISEMPPMLQYHLRPLRQIEQVHNNMIAEMRKCKNSPSKIAKVLVSFKKDLEVYLNYMQNVLKISEHMDELTPIVKKYPGIKDDIRCTWRKFVFYILNLESFLKNCGQEEKPAIVEAIDIFRDLSMRADTQILIKSIKGVPFPLHTLGNLLLHSPFKARGSALKGDLEIRAFLFQQSIVITEHKKDRYDFLVHLPMQQVYICGQKTNSPKNFALAVNFAGTVGTKTYKFKARDSQTKDTWMLKIGDLLIQNAKDERQLQQKNIGSRKTVVKH